MLQWFLALLGWFHAISSVASTLPYGWAALPWSTRSGVTLVSDNHDMLFCLATNWRAGSRFIVGANFGLPASVFCICRFLAQIASPRSSIISRSEKRYRTIFELVMCVGLPIVMAGLCAYNATISSSGANLRCSLYSSTKSFRCLRGLWVWRSMYLVLSLMQMLTKSHLVFYSKYSSHFHCCHSSRDYFSWSIGICRYVLLSTSD